MTTDKQFPDFDLPKKEVESSQPLKPKKGIDKLYDSFYRFIEKRFGASSKLTAWARKLKPAQRSEDMDALSRFKQRSSSLERTNLLLTIILIIVLIFAWQKGPDVLAEVDQLKNDLEEQEQVIKMEQQNNLFLERMAEDRNLLTENIHKVYAAVPDADEKAEEVIAMLEDIAAKNKIVIDAIGIRKIAESQINYDDLIGVVDIYEYTFTLENSLPHILSFVAALRNSLRLMDIMTLEIEEGKNGAYRASFSLHAYHLTSYGQ
jgi:hypothetical protein